MRAKLTFIIGCTACGKSEVAFELARRAGAEIVVVDSMKVYRRMDIGTGKPSAAQHAAVSYHMIDVVEPSEEFSVARYVSLADRAIADVHARGQSIVVVGGTALYIKGLVHGLFEGPGEDAEFRARLRRRAAAEGTEPLHGELQRVDPATAERVHRRDYRRIERALEVFALTGKPISQLQTQWDSQEDRYECTFIGLRRDLEDQHQRINMRVKRMMEAGLLDEVKMLLAGEKALSRQASQALGYAELIEHLHGRRSLDKAVERIKINSRRLAKSQRTWFKRFRNVQWIDLAPGQEIEVLVEQIVRQTREKSKDAP